MSSSGRIDSIVRRVMDRLEREGVLASADPTVPTPRPSPAARVSGGGPIFETVDEACAAARAAFLDLSECSLETRDAMIAAMRRAVEEHARDLSELAVEETGLGRVEDKIQKNLLVGRKSPGTEDLVPIAKSGDHGLTLEERAPYGVILSVTPSTNPTETIINNGIGMVAGGNTVVFAPHPGAKRVSHRGIELLEAAMREAGGPPNVFTTVAEPSIEATQAMMRHPQVRLLVVTGGGAVVKEAMSVGKRAITAGPGNPPVVVDGTADLDRAARGIVAGASFDNNIICTDEKEVVAVERIRPELMRLLTAAGAHELSGAELEAVRRATLKEERGPGRPGVVNRELVGRDARVILEAAGLSGPGDPRLLVAAVEPDHPFLWTEMMMPVIGVAGMPDVDAAIDFAREVEGGNRHTAGMYSRNVEKLSRMARVIDCSIFVKNGPHFNGLGKGGEGFTSFTIASPTGEGMTSARSFTRFRRCALIDSFRIV
jgi:acyl-CoA reductase-like NAD-dependent aldehyde dehydrogenase